MMANLVAHSGDNKGQLTTLSKAINRDFIAHDLAEIDKLLEWQTQKNTKGASGNIKCKMLNVKCSSIARHRPNAKKECRNFVVS